MKWYTAPLAWGIFLAVFFGGFYIDPMLSRQAWWYIPLGLTWFLACATLFVTAILFLGHVFADRFMS